MGFLPEHASFEELVADAFAAFRGTGVMLSPLDAELVTDWSARQIPFEVIARGLQRAAEKALWDAKPGEPALRSIRACRREVEAEIKKHRRLSTGAGTPVAQVEEVSTVETASRRLSRGLKKLAKEQPVFESLCARVKGELIREDRVEGFEQRFPIQALRALPFAQRLALLREAKALARGQVILSAHGRKLSRRFHRAAVLRRTLDLQPFW